MNTITYEMSGRKSKKQTYFNDSCLNEKRFGINNWILKGSTSTSFRCKVCNGNKDITLGSRVSEYRMLVVSIFSV